MLSIDSNSFFANFSRKFQNSIWIALTVFVKAVSQLIILKFISYFYGSSGVGYLGQVLSCVTIVNSLLSVGLVNFLVTELAGAANEKRIQIYKAVASWCLFFQIFLIIIGLFFTASFSTLVFNNEKETMFFIALAFGFVFFNMSSIGQGYMSSTKNVKSIFLANLISSVIGISLFYFLISRAKDAIPEAALAFYYVQGFVLFIFFLKYEPLKKFIFIPQLNVKILKKIFKFTIVMSVTGALGALQQIYMRHHILEGLGLEWGSVGHWQAILKISEINLSFIGLTMVSLYLPSIAAQRNSSDVRTTAKKFFTQVFILVLFAFLILGALAKYVLLAVYSKDFMFLSDLLRIQLLGDIFKLCSWIFTYFFLAKLSLILFLGIEIASLLVLTGLGLFLSAFYKLDGLIYAQAINSILFFIITFFIYQYYSKRDRLWNLEIT